MKKSGTKEVLKVSGLSASYSDFTILKDISFCLQAGEILAVVGESGSGKSTLLKSILGISGGRTPITSGHIYLNGEEITGKEGEKRRQLMGSSIGMIFQNAGASFCPVRRVGPQIYESVREQSGWSREEFYRRAEGILKEMGLTSALLESYPFHLSGGMAQRAGILAAMLLNPPLLLADEPTAALDTVTQAEVVKLLLRLCRSKGTGIVLVTHHLGVAYAMADHILVLRRGEIAEYGTKEQIFLYPKEQYTKELIQAVPGYVRAGIA